MKSSKVYTPVVRFPKIDTSVIPGKKLRVWWYNPREGTAMPLGEVDKKGSYEPRWNQQPWKLGSADWVLVIDDASENYPSPGTPLCTKKIRELKVQQDIAG